MLQNLSKTFHFRNICGTVSNRFGGTVWELIPLILAVNVKVCNKNTTDKIDGQDWAGNVLARLGWG